MNTHLDLDHIHLCGVYFTSAKPTDVPLESTYLKQLADNLGIAALPSIAPTTKHAPFDGVKNAFQIISDNLAHHHSKKFSQPMTMKQKLKPILILAAGVVAVIVIISLLPRPKITFGIFTQEKDLQEPAKIFYGTQVELKWDAQHATETQLVIRSTLEKDGIVPKTMLVDNSGIKKLPVDKPMVATLIATNYYLFNIPVKFFSFTKEKTITINLLPPKVTCISLDGECLIQDHHNPDKPMKANQPICYGSEKTLSWEVVGAKTVSPIFQGSQPTNTQPPVILRVDTPTTFMLSATNGIDTTVSELALPLATPQIECLSVNGQCVESAQLNDLCFGDTLDIQVKGSCYQSLTSQLQTDERKKTIEETLFTLKPEKPTQLSVIATNGIEEVKKDLAINFKPPVIECLSIDGQCVESDNFNNLCFGKTLDIQVEGSCYQSLTSQVQTDERKKTIEETQFTLKPEQPTQLSVIATNGIEEVKKDLAINFKPPVIECLSIDGQCVESDNFNNLCFGDTLDIQVEGSCYQSLTSQVQTDELKTIEETQFTLKPEQPTQLSVIATNGIEEVKQDLAINFKPPVIDCLAVNGQCVESEQLNDLCFGDTLAIQVKGSCYQSVMSQLQTDERKKTIEETQFTLKPEQPTQLSVIATNGIEEVKQDLAINFKPPVIDCLAVNGQCVKSAQLNDLCFGDTLDIQVEGSCYQSVTSQVQTDELKTIEETQFSLKPEQPTQLSVIATNGIEKVKQDLAINFKPPVIECLAVNGQCVESAQLNDLCFGDTLDIQVKGSCYQSLTSQVQTDELKTIEETQFTLKPEQPTQLSVIATNAIEKVKQDLAINFKPPVIHTFCGPGSTVVFGSVQPFNWETSCSAKVVLKPVTETPEAPITSTDAEGDISRPIESTRYELTAYNHLGETAQLVPQVIDLKVATEGLLPVKLKKSGSSFMIQRHEVTQKEYQECDSCEQWADNKVYDSLYCIHGIDWKNQLLLGGQSNNPKAIVCLNAEQAEELLETEEFEQFNYQPSPDSLNISEQALPKECWVSLADSILFGWPGDRLQQENLPAVCVSWKDAATYANWKSQQQGLTRCYDKSFILQSGCDGYRLPTNQEWQWAALGIESQERWFPWGKARLDCKNLGLQPDCTLPLPRQVETNPLDKSSPFGAKDMGLSVSEWVNDRNGEVVIARGLNYTTYWPTFTDDHRFDQYRDQDENYLIEDRVSNIGFRLVQSWPPSQDETEKARYCVTFDAK